MPRLAGAGGVVLQRPDALAKVPPPHERRHCRLRRWRVVPACAGITGSAASMASIGEFGPSAASLLCDFGGDIIDAFAQQCIFHALPPGCRHELSAACCWIACDVALQLGAFVAGNAKLFLDRRFSVRTFFRAPAICRRSCRRFRRAIPWRCVRGFARLAQLLFSKSRSANSFALGSETRFQIVDAVPSISASLTWTISWRSRSVTRWLKFSTRCALP